MDILRNLSTEFIKKHLKKDNLRQLTTMKTSQELLSHTILLSQTNYKHLQKTQNYVGSLQQRKNQ
jgi:hypothetical protein